VRARWTLALLSLPPGLWMAQGRDACGEIWFDNLGVDATAVLPPAAWLNLGRHGGVPQRLHAGHKGSYGDVVVLGGASGMVGAATLAARAALQAGAGRVYLQALDPATARIDQVTPELMSTLAVSASDDPAGASGAPVHAAAAQQLGADEPGARQLEAATVVAGCGGGRSVTAHLHGLIRHAARLVLDADALNALAGQSALQQALRERGRRGLASVITPHPLEAARLLGSNVAQVQRDRLLAAQALADQLACCVVLKGSGSVIAAPGCTPAVNPSGNAALATPGSGDVLAGWLAGHWSQAAGHVAHGTAAASSSSRHTADLCAAAVWSHGRAAEFASPAGKALPASLLVAELGAGRRAGRW
jgi:hydroxyethylthiazole kinase-like uncharacterized protein yjeF